MTFLQRLRTVNTSRCARWHGPDSEPWTGADWSNAMCGEAGEAANVVKKIRRIETRTVRSISPMQMQRLVRDLADEIADTIIYADLLANHYGIDLEEAIVSKYNAVSVREGFPERMVIDGEVVPTVRACPECGHARHRDDCLNMASDNDCGCTYNAPAAVTLSRAERKYLVDLIEVNEFGNAPEEVGHDGAVKMRERLMDA